MITGLMLVKAESGRLKDKNILDFNGVPMFVVNLRKCLQVFDKVVVSSDNLKILQQAKKEGADVIMRDKTLCGDTPNIPVYQHALQKITEGDIVAVQANSPTVDIKLIKTCKNLLEDYDEVMTCHKDYSIYGSIWALKRKKLLGYKNCYKPKPDVLIIDKSIDIHTIKDYNEALKQNERTR